MEAAKWLSTTTLLSDLISGKDEGFESQGCRRGTQVYHLNGMRGEFGNTSGRFYVHRCYRYVVCETSQTKSFRPEQPFTNASPIPLGPA